PSLTPNLAAAARFEPYLTTATRACSAETLAGRPTRFNATASGDVPSNLAAARRSPPVAARDSFAALGETPRATSARVMIENREPPPCPPSRHADSFRSIAAVSD